MTGPDPALGRWPTAELDPVRRLRVLGGALPGTHLAERAVDAGLDQVWAFLSDLERNIPRFDPLVRRLRIVRRRPAGLDVIAWARGVPVPFRVRLHRRPASGLLWMQAPARTYLVATAVVARPDDQCRIAHLEGVPRLAWPRPGLAGHVQSDLDRLARLVSEPHDFGQRR